jgi:hypothetical protein
MVCSTQHRSLGLLLTRGCRDQELRFTVRDPPDEYQMTVSVINDDKIPQLIGDTLVNLRQVLVPGGGQSDFWYKLQYRGKYAGEIRIMIIYDDSMGQSVPDQEIDRAHDPVTRPTGPEPAAKQVPLQASSRRTTTSSEERLSTAIFERARGKSGASPPSDTVAAIKYVTKSGDPHPLA